MRDFCTGTVVKDGGGSAGRVQLELQREGKETLPSWEVEGRRTWDGHRLWT